MPTDKETIILRKYKKPVIQILKDLRERRLLRETCRDALGGMNPARLTELIKGDREVTSYYLSKFLQGGIVSVKQLLQGKKLEDLPEADRVLIEKLSLDDSIVKSISEIRSMGVDVDHHLKVFLHSLKESSEK